MAAKWAVRELNLLTLSLSGKFITLLTLPSVSTSA